jgi:hypothetical protein
VCQQPQAARPGDAQLPRRQGLFAAGYHDTTWQNGEDAAHTGFTYMLPYLEQNTVFHQFRLKQQWYLRANYAPVAVQIPQMYCPSNRRNGTMDLTASPGTTRTAGPTSAAFVVCTPAAATSSSATAECAG